MSTRKHDIFVDWFGFSQNTEYGQYGNRIKSKIHWASLEQKKYQYFSR
ncbi:hypothetical protein [Terrilactibacillus laevilacticus]|uniref:Uncharacterized protein n=1 Tax=Terrilactibacillus laevilacticus TaxID=1380157 RepID=A0ABW5PMR5_9BACI|nr:hypothetical protein [Terrilactibacillus laevilacticus]